MSNTINVLVLFPAGEAEMKSIREVSPRLNVINAAHLMPVFFPKPEPPDPAKEKELDVLLADTEVIYGFAPPRNVIARAPKLKWIQTLSAGVDRTLTPDITASRVTMTNVSGMHAVPISEYVFTVILAFAKNFPQYVANQKEIKWERYPSSILDGKTLGILGLGHIGRQVAHVGKAFGMRVAATRRHCKQAGKARDCDAVYPHEQLDRLLAESDFIVNCLPYTRDTDKFIGEKELRQMKSNAFIVNIGRGKTIDEAALFRALQEKRIAGAGLDTFEQEPLPPDSPLWKMPNVIITPHMSGWTDDYGVKALTIFIENLKRYVSGRRLFNVVDKKAGY
jgi:phosphoglycerate dehydrogenase-like enzyme